MPVMPSLLQTNELTGVVLLAPMISLEKVSKKGLNPYLRYGGTARLKRESHRGDAKTSKNPSASC